MHVFIYLRKNKLNAVYINVNINCLGKYLLVCSGFLVANSSSNSLSVCHWDFVSSFINSSVSRRLWWRLTDLFVTRGFSTFFLFVNSNCWKLQSYIYQEVLGTNWYGDYSFPVYWQYWLLCPDVTLCKAPFISRPIWMQQFEVICSFYFTFKTWLGVRLR